MSRGRTTLTQPQNDGLPCDADEESKVCNGFACNQDCDLGIWSEWGLCSKACDSGFRERTKPVVKEARGLGHCDAPDSEARLETESCNPQSCQSLIPQGRSLLECTAEIDVIIVLDGSGSLGSYGWQESKETVEKLVGSLKGGETGVNVGVILFSGPAQWRNWFVCTRGSPNDSVDPAICGVQWVRHLSSDTADVHDAVEKLRWPRRTTLTSFALATAEQEIINGRQDANTVVIVITDGKPLSPKNTGTAAEKLKEKARLMWVPVGTGVKSSIANMKTWATQPWQNNLIEVDTFAALDTPTIINSMIAEFCPELR